jgi:hypothetical protein
VWKRACSCARAYSPFASEPAPSACAIGARLLWKKSWKAGTEMSVASTSRWSLAKICRKNRSNASEKIAITCHPNPIPSQSHPNPIRANDAAQLRPAAFPKAELRSAKAKGLAVALVAALAFRFSSR